jgi:hypothetical protein
MPRIRILASIGILAAVYAAVAQTPEKSVEVIPVKYDQLKQEVLKHRGKVLVVDFWAGT